MKIKFTLLGCGYSMGVPRIDGYFGSCDPKEKKNYRTRCSAAISVSNKNYLIDTSPDLKNQLLNNKIKSVDGIAMRAQTVIPVYLTTFLPSI